MKQNAPEEVIRKIEKKMISLGCDLDEYSEYQHKCKSLCQIGRASCRERV